MSYKRANVRHLLHILLAVSLMLLPSLAFAAGGGHADSGAVLKDFLYRVFNFSLMAGLLYFFVAKPIRNGLKTRREDIAKALAEAQSAREEAEAKHREYSEKLAKATEEITEIRASIKRDGEMERDRILAAAKEMAAKIEKETENKASSVVTKARTELREEAARLAVELAEELLKKQVTAADQKRLVDEYLQKVGELH